MQEIDVFGLFSALNKQVEKTRNGKATKEIKLSDFAKNNNK